MKRHIVLYSVLTILCSCGTSNLLNLKHRSHYKESSVITSDPAFVLRQRVSYDRPAYVDEEFSYELALHFIDTAAAKMKRTLDLQTDTLIVKARYGVSSVWSWSGESSNISGQIEILKWSNTAIVLKENIRVKDTGRKEKHRYRGTRTFRPKAGW